MTFPAFMEKSQLNADINPEVNVRFRKDAAEMGVTLGTWLEAAITTLLRYPKEERAIRFSRSPKKIFGRKAKL